MTVHNGRIFQRQFTKDCHHSQRKLHLNRPPLYSYVVLAFESDVTREKMASRQLANIQWLYTKLSKSAF